MTVTSRFLAEGRNIAERQVPCPFATPPLGRVPIGRLCFDGPSPKLDWEISDLENTIGVASLETAVFFLDTSIFTRDLDPALWNALCRRRISILPGVWKELQPWLKNPFRNQTIRNAVLAAAEGHIKRAGGALESRAGIEMLSVDEDFTNHGYDYYRKLLSMRKAIGPVASAVLTKKLGRSPNPDELAAELQGFFGERGFLLARKGIEAANSPNKLTDEELVVMAVLTAILRGVEVFIMTRDPDVLEQYFKVLCLMKEHYRAMLAAAQYAANPGSMAFREVAVENDGLHPPEFASSPVLRFEATDSDFNPLPPKFNFTNIYCILLGGDSSVMKVSLSAFCAETEMAQMLRIKASTAGLNTDKFDGRNCIIRTAPLAPEQHQVTVLIGRETMIPFGPFGKVGLNDFNNTLFCNEAQTRFFWNDPGRLDPR